MTQTLGHVLSAAGNQGNRDLIGCAGRTGARHPQSRYSGTTPRATANVRRRAGGRRSRVPLTRQAALLAGGIDAEQQTKGVKIPFQDLLIGTTALDMGYAVVTGNPRHFQMIPNLTVIDL